MGKPTQEGETTVCKCGTKLVAILKTYANFPSKLQWTNPDGSAHYSTNNGKDFTCNIPEDKSKETTQQTIESPEESTPDKKIPEISKDLEKFALKENTLLSQITKVVSEELQKALKSGEAVRGDIVWVRTKEIYTQWKREMEK